METIKQLDNLVERGFLAWIDHAGDFGLNNNWGKNHEQAKKRGFKRFCVDCGKGIGDNGVSALVIYTPSTHLAIRFDISPTGARNMFPEWEIAYVPLGKTCAKKLGIGSKFQRAITDYNNPDGGFVSVEKRIAAYKGIEIEGA